MMHRKREQSMLHIITFPVHKYTHNFFDKLSHRTGISFISPLSYETMALPPPSNTVEYLSLTSESLAAQNAHRALLLDLEARKRASTIDVPTLPNQVRDMLRSMGHPIRLFGEDLAAIRQRLRMELARQEVMREEELGGIAGVDEEMMVGDHEVLKEEKVEEITEVTYTHASKELVRARKVICDYSLEKSRSRLDVERRRRRGMVRWTRGKKRARLFNQDDDDDFAGEAYIGLKDDALLVKELDDNCEKIYKTVRNQALEGSQYGDVRPLSAVCTSSLPLGCEGRFPKLIATGGWSGGIKIWNGGTDHNSVRGEEQSDLSPLDLLGAKSIVHEDRIMGVAMRPYVTATAAPDGFCTMVASASIDLTAKLCKVTLNQDASDEMDVDESKSEALKYHVEEVAHLKGHAARLCSVAFHPTGQYVATTSFDHTWRLWDVATSNMHEGTELLLQDGHAKEVYGVGFHQDGSLVATTDFGGVVQCWDLRTGKSICHFLVCTHYVYSAIMIT
jgi:U4/U6 small nuclear ribonucleoprotein PRP4